MSPATRFRRPRTRSAESSEFTSQFQFDAYDSDEQEESDASSIRALRDLVTTGREDLPATPEWPPVLGVAATESGDKLPQCEQVGSCRDESGTGRDEISTASDANARAPSNARQIAKGGRANLTAKQDLRHSQPEPTAARRTPATKADVFDILSKTLAEHASTLSGEDQLREEGLREQVVESLADFKTDRIRLAGCLVEYKALYKSQRQWTRIVTEIGATVNLSARTIFRMIEEYEDPSSASESEQAVDGMELAGGHLSKSEEKEMRARLAIRALLDDVATNRKQDILASVLAEETYQIWGRREEFQISIKPRKSRFTIDGRKREGVAASEEVTT
jgi:hypothetical protein